MLLGALIAYLTTPSRAFIAVVTALGTGLLIGSVAFELIDEASKRAEVGVVGLYTLAGAAVFIVGDWWLERRGGGDRKDANGAQADCGLFDERVNGLATRAGRRHRVWQ